MKITVLMSAYNGEKFIEEQLESIFAQRLPQDAELSVLVRDDGSTDSTKDILTKYADEGKIDWYDGENLRPAKSFWHLVKNAPKSDYYAFCDQDDVWFPDKLSRAIESLSAENDVEKPLLYCANVTVTDGALKPKKNLIADSAPIFTDFAHSLIYSLAPGCTMVFNAEARERLVRYDMAENFVIIHDWLAHKIVSMFGTVIYDKEPCMFYRQHENNVIGAQSEGRVKKFFKRVKRVLGAQAYVRSENAKSLERVYGAEASEENAEILGLVAHYRENGRQKRKFLRDKRFVTGREDFVLRMLIRVNKL